MAGEVQPTWARRDQRKLALVRLIHTVIYLVMAASTLLILWAGVSGYVGAWLYVASILVAIEAVVFLGNGMTCPLTQLAQKYGAEKGWAFDTFLPERATRYTFRVFGTLLAIGVVLLVLRAVGVLGPKQTMDELMRKAEAYLAAGVKACWILQPMIETLSVLLPGRKPQTYTSGEVTDSATGITVTLEEIFA